MPEYTIYLNELKKLQLKDSDLAHPLNIAASYILKDKDFENSLLKLYQSTHQREFNRQWDRHLYQIAETKEPLFKKLIDFEILYQLFSYILESNLNPYKTPLFLEPTFNVVQEYLSAMYQQQDEDIIGEIIKDLNLNDENLSPLFIDSNIYAKSIDYSPRRISITLGQEQKLAAAAQDSKPPALLLEKTKLINYPVQIDDIQFAITSYLTEDWQLQFCIHIDNSSLLHPIAMQWNKQIATPIPEDEGNNRCYWASFKVDKNPFTYQSTLRENNLTINIHHGDNIIIEFTD